MDFVTRRTNAIEHVQQLQQPCRETRPNCQAIRCAPEEHVLVAEASQSSVYCSLLLGGQHDRGYADTKVGV